ncbi:MAG: hypothetical protein M3273_09390 [Actinomycetota bacterium]|nr:hypothetical protein [Actinomycetota bacterium]
MLGIVSDDTAEQLRNIAEAETTTAIGFGLLVAAYVLLAFGLFTLAGEVYERRRRLAAWGGSLAIAALFGLVFFTGIGHVQQQAAILDDPSVIVEVLENDDAFTPVIFLPVLMLGFPLLAYGAYRADVLPWWGALGLAMILLLPVGVIGGIPVVALIATVGVAAACVPLGLRLWARGPEPAET